jgi:hypothetical protein
LEKALDPKIPKDAVELMRRRIKMVIDACKTKKGVDCTVTDKYIAAALAQNGWGFRYDRMRDAVRDIQPARTKFYYYPDRVLKDWLLFFQEDAAYDYFMINTRTQLKRFDWVISELQRRGWFVSPPPLLDTADINKIKNLDFNKVSK